MGVIVLLDNDPLQARILIDNLTAARHNVLWTQHSWTSLLTIHSVHPDLVIVDCAVPHWVQLLTVVRAMRGFGNTPLLLLYACHPPRYYLGKLGVTTCIAKPFNADTLVDQVQAIIKRQYFW